MNYTSAFARYGAKLTNPQWSVSAFNPDGELVVSLWQNGLNSDEQSILYKDDLSKWLGNYPGREELRRHLRQALGTGASVRLVIAHPVTTQGAELVGKVPDESAIKKDFFVRPDLLGRVEYFNGDIVHLRFRHQT